MYGQHYVDGAFVPGNGPELRVSDPSDLTHPVGSWRAADQELASRAVEAAARAFTPWQQLPGPTRGQLLFSAAEKLAASRQGVAELASHEMGKPLAEMLGEVDRGVALLRYYAGETTRSLGEVLPSAIGDALLFSQRVPIGPIALITPWNFPVAIPLWKAAPALAFGNTVVLKPAEWSSLTATALAEIFAQAGFPDGVFNVVLGEGAKIGRFLSHHPRIRGISFTGSRAAGMDVAQGALEHAARFQLEMGGKNPAIVLEDADLNIAAERIVSGAMRSAGQKCTATSRVIAVPSILSDLREALLATIKGLKQGPAWDMQSYLGPVVSERQEVGIRGKIAAGIAEGARVLSHPEGEVNLPRGYYISPTLLDQAKPGGTLHQEEIFGPVLALFAAKDATEAIDLANSVPYGLSASLFTRDLDRALYYIKHIEAGLVRVNEESAGVEYQAPFGGVKESSYGGREQGRAAIEFYTESRTVTIRPSR